ncbi:MAG: hypothetical protein K6T91_01135 [Firmicutes bacterium]|nr:hypothetical protein [Bacillota bacterium]
MKDLQSLKKLGILVLVIFVVAIIATGCGGSSTKTEKQAANDTKPEASTIEGTIYLPGEGGHIAVAKIAIDPAKDEPIAIKNLDRIKLGAAETNATHDIRIDADKNVAFSSAIVKDASAGGIHVDKIDLSTLQVTKDIATPVPPRYVGGPFYCASGQSDDAFLPVIMGYEGSIDVFDKETLELKHRVQFDDPQIGKDYIFAHGTNTPDKKQFLLALNVTAPGKGGEAPPRSSGDLKFCLLDMESLLQGTLKINKVNTIAADTTAIAFRQTFTSDGKYLLQAARDRILVIDGSTLQLVKKIDVPKEGEDQIECHDIMPTPDGKYAVAALRVPVGKDSAGKAINDGKVALVDLEKGTIVGKQTSICYKCHNDYTSLKGKGANLCGIDGIWK